MTRDEILKQETIKIIEGMGDNVEATAAQILNLHSVGMSKGEALTRLWWLASVDERTLFLMLIEAMTSKGVCWLVDIEKDLPETDNV